MSILRWGELFSCFITGTSPRGPTPVSKEDLARSNGAPTLFTKARQKTNDAGDPISPSKPDLRDLRWPVAPFTPPAEQPGLSPEVETEIENLKDEATRLRNQLQEKSTLRQADAAEIEKLKVELRRLKAQVAEVSTPPRVRDREPELLEQVSKLELRLHGFKAAADQAEADNQELRARLAETEAALASSRAEADRAREEGALASQRVSQARLGEAQARARAAESEAEASALRRELKATIVEAQKQLFRTQELEQQIAAARVERAELEAGARHAEEGDETHLAAINAMRSACFAQLSVMNEHIRTLTDAVEAMSRERWEASTDVATSAVSCSDFRSPVPSAAPSSPRPPLSPHAHSPPPLPPASETPRRSAAAGPLLVSTGAGAGRPPASPERRGLGSPEKRVPSPEKRMPSPEKRAAAAAAQAARVVVPALDLPRREPEPAPSSGLATSPRKKKKAKGGKGK